MLPRTLWRLHGLRPANHPQRRLALGARWLVSEDLPGRLKDWCMQDIPAGKLCASLAEVLEAGTDDFWSWHWSLGSARLPRPQRLLGLGRVSDLGVNVVLPWLYARTSGDGVRGAEGLRDRVTDRYFAWRATEDNSVLRLARKRLLASGSGPGYELQVKFSRAALQQGLLQIVRDFWNSVWHGGWRSVLITGSIFAASLAAAIVYAWGVDSGAIESGTFAERLGSALTVLSVMLVSTPLVITGLSVLARSLYGYAAGKELMWLPNLEVSVSTCPDIRAPATRAPCAQQESALREIGANHDAKDKAPPSNLPGTVWAETVPRRGRRLKHIRHSLYDDPAVDTVIDRWAVHAFRHDAPSPGSAHSVPADSART